jgi:choline dehydrogenase-like flavoprotein
VSTSYDAIVIGSGAGGAAAAFRMVKAGMRVLLLEKGTTLPLDGSTLDVRQVVHEGRFLSREPWLDGRGRRLVPEEHFNLGGKTKWYGAALFRFDEHEFDSDAQHDCPPWPISLSELEPYYCEAERLLGVRRFEREPDLARIARRVTRGAAGWRAAAMPMGLAATIEQHPAEAAHFDGFASVRGLKGEAETALLSQLSDQRNLTVRTNAEVALLLPAAGQPKRIAGVQLRDGTRFEAPSILLAAGALHSPRLLARYLRSNDLDVGSSAALIGRNLKLHLLTAMVALSPGLKGDLIRKTTVFFNSHFPHSTVQPLGFDGELIATLMPRVIPGGIRKALGRRAYGFFLQTEDGSHPDNRVHDAALPVLDYAESRLPVAANEHRKFTRAFQRALLRSGMISFTQRIGLQGTAHACGSLMCGASPTHSVVNAKGEVHGLSGLYVVDGSVLPRSSRVNPALTIYAWALRIADLIGRDFVRDSSEGSQPEYTHAAT